MKLVKPFVLITKLTALTSFILFTFTNSYSLANEKPLEPWQNSAYILKAFKEIALKNEYQTTKSRVLKWQAPIRYQFKYHQLPQNSMVENLFNTHLNHLQSITSQTFTQVIHRPNLVIHLTKDSHYGKVIQNHTHSKVKNLDRASHCMGSFTTNAKGEIIKGQIVVPVDHTFSRGLLVTCIIEESTQLMGLPNDSNWVHPSIANDKSKIEFLTGLDYLMLKLLYANNIKAGMKGKTLEHELKQTLNKLEATGEIEKAPQKVNSEGLFPAVN